MFAVLFTLTGAKAMSYEEARDRARYLTDKMAYELNLNDAQYNDAYEINLDYLMNIRTESDAYGVYWEYRNADLRHILYDWQFSIFHAADHFFRPIIWRTTGWFLPIYDIYPVTHFYYNPPRVYHEYRGGHCHYRFNHHASFYADRRPVWNGGFRGEHRGPVAGRPERYGNRHNGFRFENGGRPEHDRRQERPQNAGFRFERVGNRPQSALAEQPDNGRGNGRRTQATMSRPQMSRGNNRPNIRNHRTESSYNRPSSTRTTVNRTPQGGNRHTPRTQSTPRVQRSTSRGASGRVATAPHRSSGPSRSGR